MLFYIFLFKHIQSVINYSFLQKNLKFLFDNVQCARCDFHRPIWCRLEQNQALGNFSSLDIIIMTCRHERIISLISLKPRVIRSSRDLDFLGSDLVGWPLRFRFYRTWYFPESDFMRSDTSWNHFSPSHIS